MAGLRHRLAIAEKIAAETDDHDLKIALARQHAVPVSYDLNYRPRLWPAARARAIAEATIAMIHTPPPNSEQVRARASSVARICERLLAPRLSLAVAVKALGHAEGNGEQPGARRTGRHWERWRYGKCRRKGDRHPQGG